MSVDISDNKDAVRNLMEDMYRFRLMEPELQVVDEKELSEDREYLMKMYPARARIVMAVIEDECDRLEYEGSPMLVMYPDKQFVLGLALKVCRRIGVADSDEDFRHMIEIMICDEFFVRRSRYKRRRKFF